jgi:hypothetical protein
MKRVHEDFDLRFTIGAGKKADVREPSKECLLSLKKTRCNFAIN